MTKLKEVSVIPNDIRCDMCEHNMRARRINDKVVLICVNEGCEEFGVRYKLPSMILARSDDKKARE